MVDATQRLAYCVLFSRAVFWQKLSKKVESYMAVKKCEKKAAKKCRQSRLRPAQSRNGHRVKTQSPFKLKLFGVLSKNDEKRRFEKQIRRRKGRGCCL